MRKRIDGIEAFMDCKKWAEALNTRVSYNSELSTSNRKAANDIYTSFGIELNNVRRLVSATVYEEMYYITKAPHIFGEWNMRSLSAAIGINESKMARLKEPDTGVATTVGPYELFIEGIDSGIQTSRKRPEGFFVPIGGLYKLAYYFLNKSCERILFGDECAPIHLPNRYSCLFTQIAATPYADSLAIQKKIRTECKQRDKYMMQGTASGFKQDNFIYEGKKSGPIDFQELYVKRLKEKMEDDCSIAPTLFGTEANSQLRNYSERCYNVTNDAIEAADRAIIYDRNGKCLKSESKKKKQEPNGTMGNLMILSIGLDMAVDYFVAPDYTKYSTLLARTNMPDQEKNAKEYELDDAEKKTLSALLIVDDDEERSEIISDALCDCWVAQYTYELKNS